MNIMTNIIRGTVSITVAATFIVSLVAVNTASAQTVEELQAQLAALTAQLANLEGGSATSSVVSVGNAACPFTWTRNLTIGSTGDDVRQLQRFLNSDPQTRVATSGVGSSGNESSYYGPITAAAVSKFQEKYAAAILSPVGLTRGTGGFYTSTRRQANALCVSGSTASEGGASLPKQSTQTVVVKGDALAVTAGPAIGDGYAIKGAQNVPFTSFVLTAGNDDVRIAGIRIRRFGLSNYEQLESVAVVDQDGIQYGSARGLSSNDEATVGTGIELRRGESKTFALVGNITNKTADIDSGATIGLEIYEVKADAQVSGVGGNTVIRGATHVVSEALDLQGISVEVDNASSDIDLNDESEVVDVEIRLSRGGNREDAYLKTLILEQKGSADEEDLGDIRVLVDDDEDRTANLEINRDRYIITFSGRGHLIEEGDRVNVSIEIDTNDGSGETVKFVIEDMSDVYVVGAKNGYGLPVTVSDDGDSDTASTIGKGEVRGGGSVKDFEDEIRYGDDKIIGSLEVEFEGEDVEFEDLTFTVDVTNLGGVTTTAGESTFDQTSGDEEIISIENIRLFVDGEEVTVANDIVEIEAADVTSGAYQETGLDFDGTFEVDVRSEREVRFDIRADLPTEWSFFEGTDIQFTLTSVDKAEGVTSEKEYNATGEFFASDRKFEAVTISGNQVDFDFGSDNVVDNNFVPGADDVIFATLEVDASESGDDLEVKNVYLQLTGTEITGANAPSGDVDLDVIRDCELRVDDESVGSLRGSFDNTGAAGATEIGRFRVDDLEIDGGDVVEVDVVCNIDEDARPTDTFTFGFIADDRSTRVEYDIAGDDIEYVAASADAGESITIKSSGTLKISADIAGDDLRALAVGSSGHKDVVLTTVEFEAEDEDLSIKDVYLVDLGIVGDTDPTNAKFEEIAKRTDITLGNTEGKDFAQDLTIDSIAYTNGIRFEDVNVTIDQGDKIDFDITVDYRGITDRRGVSGQMIQLLTAGSKLVVRFEGRNSDVETFKVFTINGGDFAKNRVFPTILTVEEEDEPSYTLSGGLGRKLYEFTVHADSEGDAYLNQVAFDITVSTGLTLANLEVRNGSSPINTPVAAVTPGIVKVAFTNPEEIQAGTSETYAVYANVGGTLTDAIVTVQLADDPAATAVGAQFAASIGNFVWSPNTLDNDGATTSNADWFSGYALFKQADFTGWTISR